MKTEFEIAFSKKTAPSTMTKCHYHDYYEIYYLLSGERYYYIEDRTYLLKKGCLLFVGKNDIHKTIDASRPEHERIVFYFDDALLRPFHDEYLDTLLFPFRAETKMLALNLHEQSYAENIIFQMSREHVETGQVGKRLFLQSLVVQLLLFAARKMMTVREAPAEHMHRKIVEVLEFCKTHYREPITTSRISADYYISPSHFSRLFKRYTGFSFPEYLNTLRIREAQRLLRETKLKITEIAENVGYLNITHFNRKFKQIAQMSPLEYKNVSRHTKSLKENKTDTR
ncbi:AraC family transcriptional regulator [Paenibacillus sp. GYB003]|uniref:AraC family transcriptional regulator n=1 Tax=Paenibacillus sp. GYB003 TaxID=2994392 RepID=UPI002F963159